MKYYFWILGCAMNYSDAERMATVLESLGYTKTNDEREAGLFVVIACSVRQSAVLSIYGKVRDLNKYRMKNKEFRTILTGCILEKDKKKLGKVFDVMLEIKDLEKLPVLLGFKNKPLSGDYLSITPHYESAFRAYVPISTGCDNYCSYCAVPYTKGREKSRQTDEIFAEMQGLISSGYKEITLLGQNVNSYEYGFAELLKKLDTIPGNPRIYFYSNHPKDMTDELIATLTVLKHFPHYIHLPLQSGNDDIIRAMNRHYTKEQYLTLVAKIRKAMPDVTLTTDIIVGYPGETEEQFKDTTDVMRKAEYDMAFIAQYSPREGTVSAKQADDVTKAEKVRREKVLQRILADTVLKHNGKLIGTTQRILVDEIKKGKYYGRTEGFKVVEITSTSLSINKTDQAFTLGQYVDVIIKSVTSWKLSGRLTN